MPPRWRAFHPFLVPLPPHPDHQCNQCRAASVWLAATRVDGERFPWSVEQTGWRRPALGQQAGSLRNVRLVEVEHPLQALRSRLIAARRAVESLEERRGVRGLVPRALHQLSRECRAQACRVQDHGSRLRSSARVACPKRATARRRTRRWFANSFASRCYARSGGAASRP